MQTTHFVKSRAQLPRPMSKIIAMIALRRAILMKAGPVVSLHAHRLFSGRACSCKKDPCLDIEKAKRFGWIKEHALCGPNSHILAKPVQSIPELHGV